MAVKLFHLYRIKDQSGVSGTGPVVEGVQFSNGWCALRWMSSKSSMCFYQSIEEVEAIHGHGGNTELIVHDFAPLSKRQTKESSQDFEILMQLIEEASRILTLSEQQGGDISVSLFHMRELFQELELNIQLRQRKESA
jgi:hypothetical protein